MSNVKLLAAAPKLTDAYEVLDQLRKDMESGKVVAFCAAAIGADDVAYAYASATRPVTRLRMQGGIAQLMHDYLAGDVSTGGDG